MSYSGNSKEQVVLNNATNDQFTTLNNRISDEKSFLINVISTETNSRIAGDNAVIALVNTEVSNRQDAVSGEANLRTAGDALLDSKILDTKAFILNVINSESVARTAGDVANTALVNAEVLNRENAVSAEATARSNADTQIYAKIADEKSFMLTLNSSVSNRVTNLETGLTEQIATQLSGQTYDAAQRALIQQAVESLGDADSVIYQKIAQKASLLVNNQFKTLFNLFIQDFFNSYSLGAGGVAFNASRYEVSSESPVNEDPNL
jgi:hypothetical protein